MFSFRLQMQILSVVKCTLTNVPFPAFKVARRFWKMSCSWGFRPTGLSLADSPVLGLSWGKGLSSSNLEKLPTPSCGAGLMGS